MIVVLINVIILHGAMNITIDATFTTMGECEKVKSAEEYYEPSHNNVSHRACIAADLPKHETQR